MKEDLLDFREDDKIRAYLLGEMNDAEQLAFEAMVRKDLKLEDELNFSRQLMNATSQMELREVECLVQESGQRHQNNVRVKNRWTWFSGLMAMVLILGLTIYFVNEHYVLVKSSFEDYHLSVQNNLEPFEMLIATERGKNLNLSLGLEAYQAANYEAAAPLLSNYFLRTKDGNVGLYLAISYLELGQYEASLVLLESLEQQVELPMGYPVKWYLSLAYYGHGDLDLAQNLMQEILESDSPFRNNAKAFMDQNFNAL